MGDLNTRHEQDRIKIGRKKEKLILAYLDLVGMVVNDEDIVRFEEATSDEDRQQKIDAWAVSESGFYYSLQIKFRDSDIGKDLGLSLIRPYKTFDAFKDEWACGTPKFDRDMKTDVDFYVVMTNDGSILVVPGAEVKKTCYDLLDEFAQDRVGFGEGKAFPRRSSGGRQLRLVVDRGTGHSSGHQKLIAYLSPQFLAKAAGAFTIRTP